jgi:beta-lactamase class A
MRSDANIPLKLRISKRRKRKRARFYGIVLFLSIVIGILLYTGSFSDIMNLKALALDAMNTKEKTTETGKEATVTHDTEGSSESTKSGTEQNGEIGKDSDDMQNNDTDRNKVQSKDISVLKKEIEAYISKYKGQYGVYYLNLEDGTNFGINSTDEYIAASTVKIPINLYLFKQIKEGKVNPENTMVYTKEDYEGGTGKIQYAKVGSKYTIRKLSEYSIELSDNVATNMLLRLLGRLNVKNYMRDLGGTVVANNKNISCPMDMAIYMKEVYKFSDENPELGKELMGYFENTIFNDRIPKLLPEDVKVAHKIGNQVAALHDVGIVYAKTPYIISIMSKGINEEEAYDVIAEISRMVYDFAASAED